MRLWYRFWRDLAYWVARALWGLRVEGRENIPASGPALVASNHRSVLDPALIASSLPRETGFVAKRELFTVPVLGPLVRSLNSIPIDRSRLSLEKVGEFVEFLESGKLLLYFPEGTRQRSAQLGRPKVGVGVLLARKPVTVIPTYVEGSHAPIRNLFRRGRMRVVYGAPYSLPEETEPSDVGKRARWIAEAVMERIRQLQEEVASPGETGSRPTAASRSEAEESGISKEGMEPNE